MLVLSKMLKRKFEIDYLICKEDLPFVKMAPICELEERHSVNLGSGYKNDQACASFVSFIAHAGTKRTISQFTCLQRLTVQRTDMHSQIWRTKSC